MILHKHPALGRSLNPYNHSISKCAWPHSRTSDAQDTLHLRAQTKRCLYTLLNKEGGSLTETGLAGRTVLPWFAAVRHSLIKSELARQLITTFFLSSSVRPHPRMPSCLSDPARTQHLSIFLMKVGGIFQRSTCLTRGESRCTGNSQGSEERNDGSVWHGTV